MCRLFGFRAEVNTTVHKSLVEAENSLFEQSSRHPDGWGVAYYVGSAPHIIRSIDTAQADSLFKNVSLSVTTNTFLAHLRKATQGSLHLQNTHPFQFGPWVFAHNGNVKGFENLRTSLEGYIDPSLRRYMFGRTDSEVIFFMLLSEFKRNGLLQDGVSTCPRELVSAIATCINILIDVAGPIHEQSDGDPGENYYSFIMTNGPVMVGFNGGKDLYYSTYKKSCSVKVGCPFYAEFCEKPVPVDSVVRHLLMSSEVIEGENVWSFLPRGEIVGVGKDMVFRKGVVVN
jgi:glutamine amidotransferase